MVCVSVCMQCEPFDLVVFGGYFSFLNLSAHYRSWHTRSGD